MAQDASAARGPDDRPTSPHLSIWRWHITMAASILHRGAIFALYVGALILAGLFVSLAAGEETYLCYTGILASPLGLLVLFGLTVALVYLALANLQKLFYDFGRGFELKTASLFAWLAIIGSVVLSIAVWALAYVSGAIG